MALFINIPTLSHFKDLADSGFYKNPRAKGPFLYESCPANSDCHGNNFVPIPRRGYWVNWDNYNDTGLM